MNIVFCLQFPNYGVVLILFNFAQKFNYFADIQYVKFCLLSKTLFSLLNVV